jgi:H+-transporting ATPase
MQEMPPFATTGLTSAEVERFRLRYGPNTLADAASHPLRSVLGKLSAPVSWMLEAAILLEIVLGQGIEAAIMAALPGMDS